MDENQNNTTLPVLVTRSLLVFPNITENIEAGRPFSKKAVELAEKKYNGLLLVTSQKNSEQEDIHTSDDVYLDGTLCKIMSFNQKDGLTRIRLVGSYRVKLLNFREEDGTFFAENENQITLYGDRYTQDNLVKEILDTFFQIPMASRMVPRSVFTQLSGGALRDEDIVDNLAAYLPFPLKDKAVLLKETDFNERLSYLLKLLKDEQTKAKLDDEINQEVRERAERNQKEYFLREKMKAIQDELNEGKESSLNDIDSIKEKLEKNPYPESVKKRVNKELDRFQMMPEASLEASLIMNYIDTILNVPWYQETPDNDSLDNVQKILDEDHYGLDKVKKRIIEYLAVKQKTGNLKAPILCFYGPPGCGKTSLARSIARALGRKFYKASLGGISDEAEIRGHRRTYVGSMPGRIIQGMTRAGVRNPVFLLDEIDKVGSANYRGDCASALLEVLDPEQNVSFNDNYLEEPYDLSHVLFIATANYLENVPAPLRDRLELIEVPSYTELEKIKIATGFLVEKQVKANGLNPDDIVFTEDGIKEIIEFYTREAGVRELERLIASICRKAVVEILRHPSEKKPIRITSKRVKEYLGIEIFEDTKKEKEPQIGVVTGLAYTEFGGDILPIEVTYFQGKGGLVLTGKLGDVMKESCTIALDYVRANAEKYGIDPTIFEKNDVHIHVPEGAVPKDGPSAGVAITTAIVSSLTKKPVDNNVAMTGEVTLRGNALPIGGLREKSLAALRSGIKTIIVPDMNKKDVTELPKEVKRDLNIVYMKTVDDALKVALLH